MIEVPKGVTLIAVSKRQSEDRILKALADGYKIFGENKVQEAQSHWSHRRDGVELHLIGALQTNKVRAALDLFDVIHTIDRPKLARAIKAQQNYRTREFFVQVNTGEEAQKAGVLPKDLPELLRECEGLPVVGLMCIPPVGEVAELHFALLKTLAEEHGLEKLSMGMSADYETAIACGATHVRVGRAIFGERD